MSAPSEHILDGEIGRQSCTCGWTPPLGEQVYRAFDRHLIEVRPSERDEVAEVLALLEAHADFGRVPEPRNNADRNLGRTRYEMRCSCGERMTWNDDGIAHRQHLATLLAERDRRVAATAVAEFAHWVAIARAYNGSDHERGQSLYNECLNAVLLTWAQEWVDEQQGPDQ